MRSLERNKSNLWYSLYEDNIPVLDSDGNDTGDTTSGYTELFPFSDNISPAKGETEEQVFGKNLDYTKALSTCDNLPIDEYSLIFEAYITGTITKEKADYTVARVAKSKNSTLYALKAVSKNRSA